MMETYINIDGKWVPMLSGGMVMPGEEPERAHTGEYVVPKVVLPVEYVSRFDCRSAEGLQALIDGCIDLNKIRDMMYEIFAEHALYSMGHA